MLFLLLIAFIQTPPMLPSIELVQQEIQQKWNSTNEKIIVQSRCHFKFQVFLDDPFAIGNSFPSTSINKRVSATPFWVEDIAQLGEKFRREINHDGSAATRDTRFFNGRYSWVDIKGAKWVEQASGVLPVAQVLQDYYGEMIGLPRLSRPGLPRSLAGDSGFPYALDRLIPTNTYKLAGRERVKGEDCVILERPSLDRLWLSERCGYAIVRREWRWSMGSPFKRVIQNSDFREVAPDRWFPWNCVMEVYGDPRTNADRRVASLEGTVEMVTVDIPNDLFEPKFPAGTRIYDLDTGTQITLGHQDQKSLDRLILEAQNHRGAIRRPSTWLSYYLTTIIIIVVTIAFLFRKVIRKSF